MYRISGELSMQNLMQNRVATMQPDEKEPRRSILAETAGALKDPYVTGVTALALFLFFYHLGSYSLWDSDEPFYAYVARTMVEKGEFFTPYWNDELWFVHPPLYFWLSICISSLTGMNELSIRFASAFFAALTVPLTYFFSMSLFGRRRDALLASLILTTTLQFFLQARMALLDTVMIFFITLALYCLWRHSEKPHPGWVYTFWISSGIATLDKGPFGLCYPLLIFGIYLLMIRKFPVLKTMKWIPGLAIFLVIAAPWYVILSLRHGSAFYEPVFGYFMYRRLVSPICNQSGPFYFYVPVLIGGLFPWTFFLPLLVKEWFRTRAEKPVMLLIIWSAVTFLFFSMVGTKLPNYILPMYIPLSIGLACVFGEPLKEWQKYILGGQLGLLLYAAVMVTAGAVMLHRTGDHYLYMKPLLIAMGVCVMLIPSASIIMSHWRKKSFPFIIIALCCILYPGIVHILMALDHVRPMKPMALMVRELRKKGERVGISAGIDTSNSLVYYSDAGRITYCCEEYEKKRFLEKPGTYFYIAREEEFPHLMWYARREVHFLKASLGLVLFTDREGAGRISGREKSSQ